MSPPVFRAGYLPGLAQGDVAWQRLCLGAANAPLQVDVPRLSLAQMTALAQRVRQARQAHLATLTVAEIVALLDQAVARLLDVTDPYRQQLDHLLPLASGFDAEMVRLNLSAYLQTFRGLQLQRFVAEDFANPQLLDAFQPRSTGGWAKAFGPELMVHVWAGNVPGLPLWSFVSGLLVKAGSIGKIASAEPVFASVFARLLAEVAPRLADCFAVLWWQGGDTEQERHAFALADVVLAYGGNPALTAMQACAPVTTRFLPHGHKLSLGMVSRTALGLRQGQATARQAALDVARYDQQGCYSPHVFYVQCGGTLSPPDFARHLASELAAIAPKMARRALTLDESAQINAWRQNHELAALADSSRSVLGRSGAWGTVVYTDQAQALSPGPLNRCVLVVGVDTLDEAVALIAPQRHYLQTVGLAASPEELLGLGQQLGQAGVTRICALGHMTAPQAGWHHDGRFSLLDLVRMVDIEASTESAAERFTRYEL